MPKDAAFWQFLYLIFSKMYDERLANEAKLEKKEYVRQFVAYPADVYPPEQKDGRELSPPEREKVHREAQLRLKKRIEGLFDKVKELNGPNSLHPLFQGNETISLSPRALAFLVAELARYELSRTDIDAKGVAYQELVGTNLRGDRGQYFTPRGARRLMVEILDPKEHERVFDPACGTGGFLKETLSHLLHKMKEVEGTAGRPDLTEDLRSHQQRLETFAQNNLFGADFDPFLVRATSMQILLAANTTGNIFHMDSLAFPKGHLPGVEQAQRKVKGRKPLDFGTIDVLMTNPPFGSDIPVTDPLILEQFKDGLARRTRRDGNLIQDSGYERAVSPEVLFVQRSVEFLKPGGRLGIVLPDGLLGNPGDRHVREWILRNCWVLASVDLPVEIFIVEANVNILTSLLFLKRKTREEILADNDEDYPVFMAVAERVGFDRRGNILYKHQPDGEPLWVDQEKEERFGKTTRTFKRRVQIVDDDLPEIAEAYRAFRNRYPEPGGKS